MLGESDESLECRTGKRKNNDLSLLVNARGAAGPLAFGASLLAGLSACQAACPLVWPHKVSSLSLITPLLYEAFPVFSTSAR